MSLRGALAALIVVATATFVIAVAIERGGGGHSVAHQIDEDDGRLALVAGTVGTLHLAAAAAAVVASGSHIRSDAH